MITVINALRFLQKYNLARDTIMLQHLIIQFTLHYLSSGRLQEVKNKGKFHTFSSKSGHGRLWEVAAHKRFQI